MATPDPLKGTDHSGITEHPTPDPALATDDSNFFERTFKGIPSFGNLDNFGKALKDRVHAPTEEEAEGLAEGILGTPGKGWYAPEETWTKTSAQPKEPETSVNILPLLPDAIKQKFFNLRIVNNRRLVLDLGGNSIQFDIPILLVKVSLLFLTWFVLWLLMRGAPMEPGGVWFDPIACILISGLVGGYVSRLTFMPPLVGIMVVGIIWHMLPGNLTSGITDTVAGAAEDVAVSVIVMRAGLGLNLEALKKVSFTALALAFIPPTFEAVGFGLLSPAFFGMNFSWGLLLGFAVNAAALIIVPVVMDHSNKGYGVERGVPALVIAGAAVNVVYSIAGHGVMMSIIFSTGSLVQTMVMVPIQVCVGIVVGVCMAYVVWWMTDILFSAHPEENSDPMDPRGVLPKCFILCFCSSLSLHLGFAYYRFGGSGTLANLCFAATISHLWSTGTAIEQARKKYVVTSVASIWDTVAQPVLFALVGVSVDIKGVLDINLLPLGIISITLCLIIRSITTYPVCLGIGLRWQDILYVTITTLPKATAQAALSARAYVKALELNDAGVVGRDAVDNGRKVMSITVMSILVFAPVGLVILKASGPRLLEQKKPKGKDEPPVVVKQEPEFSPAGAASPKPSSTGGVTVNLTPREVSQNQTTTPVPRPKSPQPQSPTPSKQTTAASPQQPPAPVFRPPSPQPQPVAAPQQPQRPATPPRNPTPPPIFQVAPPQESPKQTTPAPEPQNTSAPNPDFTGFETPSTLSAPQVAPAIVSPSEWEWHPTSPQGDEWKPVDQSPPTSANTEENPQQNSEM